MGRLWIFEKPVEAEIAPFKVMKDVCSLGGDFRRAAILSIQYVYIGLTGKSPSGSQAISL